MKIHLNWTVGYSKSPDKKPDVMVKASVPGNANLDWAIANNMPDWMFGDNFKQYKWMEDCWWLYEAVVPDISLKPGETLFFIAEGIDYIYKILFDGIVVCEHEGMFSGIRLPFGDALGETTPESIQIWIAPPPKDTLGAKDKHAEAAQSCKPAVSYGWDWHPRLIPSGIWEDAYLEKRPVCYFADAHLDYQLSDDLSSVDISFHADIKSNITGDGGAAVTIYDPSGKEVMQLRDGESATLDSPELWWCNGYGKPALYSWEAVLIAQGVETDRKKGKTGFRKVELTMNEGVWEEQLGYPLSRNHAPITITLNGVPVFAKGSNWVNPEIFTGTITRDTYLPLIKLAKEANFNILRCWGGAIINKASFFELCDEYGIMVWQDFPLACNDYRGTPHYLKILEQEAIAIINKLKRYACLVLWCGGNELFNNWSKMTDQSPALRLLNKLCYDLDPMRPFIMTSPIDGMAHGNYVFRYRDGREVYQVMPAAHNTAYTEFGVPSISNQACIKMAAEEADVFPMQRNDITIAHHAFDIFDGDKSCWACLDIIESYFGEALSLDELIEQSQWLQGEGYKCIFEEARRQKPYSSMALNWCYNEPWPTLANNSIINYPAEPKSSFKDVSDACRSTLISARIPKFTWYAGEELSVELWLLNDSLSSVTSGKAEVSIEIGSRVYPVGSWVYESAPANVNKQGPVVKIKLPDLDVTTTEDIDVDSLNTKGFTEMKLIIKAGTMSSVYRLLYLKS